MNQESGGPDAGFEDRLAAARRKQGLDAVPKRPSDRPDGVEVSPWGIGLRVGVELVSALVVAVAIGYGLDRLFNTTPILTANIRACRRGGGAWQMFGVCLHLGSDWMRRFRSDQSGCRRFEQHRRIGAVSASSDLGSPRGLSELYAVKPYDGDCRRLGYQLLVVGHEAAAQWFLDGSRAQRSSATKL